MASLNHLLSALSPHWPVWVYWHELSYPAALSTLDMFKLTKMIRLPSFAGWGTKPGLSSDDDQGLGRGSLLTSFVTPAECEQSVKVSTSPRITLTWICAIFGISQHFWDDGCFPKWFRAEFGLFSLLAVRGQGTWHWEHTRMNQNFRKLETWLEHCHHVTRSGAHLTAGFAEIFQTINKSLLARDQRYLESTLHTCVLSHQADHHHFRIIKHSLSDEPLWCSMVQAGEINGNYSTLPFFTIFHLW